jgi:hypothetical protein
VCVSWLGLIAPFLPITGMASNRIQSDGLWADWLTAAPVPRLLHFAGPIRFGLQPLANVSSKSLACSGRVRKTEISSRTGPGCARRQFAGAVPGLLRCNRENGMR